MRSNCRFNGDANTGHGFAIFMASVGAPSALRAPAPVNLGVERQLMAETSPPTASFHGAPWSWPLTRS